MSCGRINILSRIKWLIGYSFSRTKRPYETGKCHDCLWCEYIQQCMEDYKCLVEPEITGVWDAFHNGETHAVYGEPVECTESHDNTLCMYDRVDQFLDELEQAEKYLDELEREGDFR